MSNNSTREGKASESAHSPQDIQSMFRALLAAFQTNQYAILPLTVTALVALSGSLYQIDLNGIPNDEIWDVHSVMVLVKDSVNASGTRTASVQQLYGQETIGTTGTVSLANNTNTMLFMTPSSTGWSAWTTVTDALASSSKTSTISQLNRSTFPAMELLSQSALTLAVEFSATTVTILASYVVVKKRRRLQPMEVYA